MKLYHKASIIVFALIICAQYLFAMDSLQMDTLYLKKKNNAGKIVIAPSVLLVASGATWGLREDARMLRNKYIPNFRTKVDDYLQYTPAASVFLLNSLGIKGKHSLGRATVSYGFSTIIMASLVNTIKYTAKVERPDGSSKNSYPSGHTANSFMNATFLHKEYGQFRSPVYSYAGYTAATATAIGRQVNNRHWISDVLAGAGIGIISTELGYLFADKIFADNGQNFKIDKSEPELMKPSFLEIKFGVAHTIHDSFKNKRNDVYAKSGFNFGVDGAWFFSKNLGIGGEFSFISFPIDDNVFHFRDATLIEIMDDYYMNPMGIRYLHIGPYFSFPLRKNWFITANISAGTSRAAAGELVVVVKKEYQDLFNKKEIPYFKYRADNAFSWGAGLGLQKRIKKNFGIKVYANYLDSENDLNVTGIKDFQLKENFEYKSVQNKKVKFDNLSYGIGLTTYLW